MILNQNSVLLKKFGVKEKIDRRKSLISKFEKLYSNLSSTGNSNSPAQSPRKPLNFQERYKMKRNQEYLENYRLSKSYNFKPYQLKYNMREFELYQDKDSFKNYIERKKSDLDPRKKLKPIQTVPNSQAMALSTNNSPVKPIRTRHSTMILDELPPEILKEESTDPRFWKKEKERMKFKMPLQQVDTRSNHLSEVNFAILNVWQLNYQNNFSKQNDVRLRGRYNLIKEILQTTDTLKEEVRPIFDNLDMDNSGFIDFKEQKMTRFLLDGVTNMNQLKQEFRQIDKINKGKIYWKEFVDLQRLYFTDCQNNMEFELQNLSNA